MEDQRTYSLLVLKLARNIHPSDSILQGHDTIVCLPTGHGMSPIFKCIPRVVYVLNKDCKRRKETNISSLNCISALSLIKEQVKNICERSLSAVRL